MERLGLLARADLDAGRCRELVVAEHAVEHAEQQRVDRRLVEGPSLREQGVDAPGAEALEVVASEGQLVEHLLQ